jgi:Fibronectin type III domain
LTLEDSVSAQLGPPYPSSALIKGVTFDWSTHIRLAEGSDNWPITWADDDHQYTSWGDGGGFGGTNQDGRVSLGVARIEGRGDNYRGFNVWGGVNPGNSLQFSGQNPEDPSQLRGKSYGIISIDGVLYKWVGPGSNTQSYEEARLFHSTDYGATWTPADWAFVKADDLIMPTILNFGKDYAGARDNFVYHYFIELQGDPADLGVHMPGKIHLLRVDKSEILTSKSSYEYFNGLDGNGNAVWSNDINVKQPVFEDPNGVGWNLAVSYNAGLKRYILTTEHTESNQGNLSIFDAPEPWGPWTTVAYMNYSDGTQFAHDFPGVPDTTFFWNFANKWLSEDGKDFTLIFTGSRVNDSWNTVKGSFEVAVSDVIPPIDTTPPVDAEPPVDATPPPVDVIPPTGSVLPTAPMNLVSNAGSTTQISLVWTPPGDSESEIASYKVYRNGVVVGTPSNPSFRDTGLTEGSSYTYQVSAVTIGGIEGPKSAPTTSSTFAGTNGILISVLVIGVVLIVGAGAFGLVLLRRRARVQ